MSSVSDSGDDPNPNPKPLESQFESLTIEESNAVIQNDEESVEPLQESIHFVHNDEVSLKPQQESSFNGPPEDNGNHEESNFRDEIVFGSSARGIGDSGSGDGASGVVWRRTNSELEVNGPSSPSSSGYAGERGSSSATSGSRMGDLSEDEIQEVGNDGDIDGVLDSQAAWVPGKRHVDENHVS